METSSVIPSVQTVTSQEAPPAPLLRVEFDDREPPEYESLIRRYLEGLAARVKNSKIAGVEVIRKRLDTGDFLITLVQPETVRSLALVERKTYEDLAASVRDRRLDDQSEKMRASGFRRLFFVIEGGTREFREIGKDADLLDIAFHGIRYHAIPTVLLSKMDAGFNVVWARDPNDFCLMIAKIAIRASLNPDFGGIHGGSDFMPSPPAALAAGEKRVAKVARTKSKIGADEFLQIALSTIEGVSRPVADKIAAEFGNSVANLVLAIDENSDETHDRIAAIRHSEGGRKIPGKIADAVISRFSRGSTGAKPEN
jgi:ERCC4-type nuclease